jgi:predicted glycosyltransferase
MYAGYASLFLRKPHIALEDTGNMEQIRLSLPVSDVVLSPDILSVDLGAKHILYRGYHELMYLTPKYFTPDFSVFTILGIPPETPYAILRFVSWEASHDRGETGFTIEEKREVVKFLSGRLKVFISVEKQLPFEFEPYRIKIPFDKMHDVLAFATVYIGEGATMASEAGILGIPSFYVSTIKSSITEDQEKHGTVFNFTSSSGVLDKIEEILSYHSTKQKYAILSKKLINSKIDVTAFLIWFIENWPGSFKIMKENPEYQERFK